MTKTTKGKISPKRYENSLVVGQSKSSPFRTKAYSALCMTVTVLSLVVMLISFNSSAWEIVTYDSEDVLNGAAINPKYEVTKIFVRNVYKLSYLKTDKSSITSVCS